MLKKLLLWPQFKQVAVQLLNYIRNFATPGTAAHQDSLSFTISRNLLKLMPIDSVMPSILFSVILFSYCLQSFPASGTFLMSQFCTSGGQSFGASLSASVILMNIQKDWLVSFRKDRFGLLAVQGTLKSLLQITVQSILRCSVFFMVQLSYPYMTTGKTIALTIQTFAGKVMFLHFNMLSRVVTAFLPRSSIF